MLDCVRSLVSIVLDSLNLCNRNGQIWAMIIAVDMECNIPYIEDQRILKENESIPPYFFSSIVYHGFRDRDKILIFDEVNVEDLNVPISISREQDSSSSLLAISGFLRPLTSSHSDLGKPRLLLIAQHLQQALITRDFNLEISPRLLFISSLIIVGDLFSSRSNTGSSGSRLKN